MRRFQAFTNAFPWQWSPSDVEDWTSHLQSGTRPLAHSTIRNYQNQLAMFCSYMTDLRYGWIDQCDRRFGAHRTQICTEWNAASHSASYEGRPEVRALSRPELATRGSGARNREGELAQVPDPGAAFPNAGPLLLGSTGLRLKRLQTPE